MWRNLKQPTASTKAHTMSKHVPAGTAPYKEGEAASSCGNVREWMQYSIMSSQDRNTVHVRLLAHVMVLKSKASHELVITSINKHVPAGRRLHLRGGGGGPVSFCWNVREWKQSSKVSCQDQSTACLRLITQVTAFKASIKQQTRACREVAPSKEGGEASSCGNVREWDTSSSSPPPLTARLASETTRLSVMTKGKLASATFCPCLVASSLTLL